MCLEPTAWGPYEAWSVVATPSTRNHLAIKPMFIQLKVMQTASSPTEGPKDCWFCYLKIKHVSIFWFDPQLFVVGQKSPMVPHFSRHFEEDSTSYLRFPIQIHQQKLNLILNFLKRTDQQSVQSCRLKWLKCLRKQGSVNWMEHMEFPWISWVLQLSPFKTLPFFRICILQVLYSSRFSTSNNIHEPGPYDILRIASL